MNNDKKDVIKSMLINVAEALGSDLLNKVALQTPIYHRAPTVIPHVVAEPSSVFTVFLSS